MMKRVEGKLEVTPRSGPEGEKTREKEIENNQNCRY
jgi:hypothetical protein